jgi:uncharacterized protein (TIGR01619 family)
MTDNWNSYALLVDGEPASIFVDIGIARSAPLPGYDDMAYLRVAMRNARPDGLSSEAEFDDLISLERHVVGEIEAKTPSVYVGRNTSGGTRDFFFFVKDAPAFGSVARSALSNFPAYRFEIGGSRDPQWTTYWNFLYPSAEKLQRMKNRDLLDRLAKRRDRPDIARQIDHFAYFGDEAGRAAFADHVRAQGFSVNQPTAQTAGKFPLEFRRSDRPSDMDDVTIALLRGARQHGGEYDGWACPVVT